MGEVYIRARCFRRQLLDSKLPQTTVIDEPERQSERFWARSTTPARQKKSARR
jgi:hypothetical protein